MRTHRFLAALLGLALLGGLPTGLTAPATAATGSTVAVAPSAASSPAARAAKPRRELNDKSVLRRGTYYIVGRVTPDGARKPVVFKRKLSKQAPWRIWKQVRTNAKGRFSVEVQFPKGTRATWYYKGLVYGGRDYRDSPTDRIYVACRRSSC